MEGRILFQPKDVKEGASYLAAGLVKEVYFSGGTYQVRLIDKPTKEEVWSFLQMDDRGNITDCFCSCHTSEESQSCPHLAASELKIFNGHEQPLHVRFFHSFWHCLCFDATIRYGERPDVLQKRAPGIYMIQKEGNAVFELHGTTRPIKERLKELLENRARETEETSLKFSNVSPEEIVLWREGRPSESLRYELSFWSDLAKWMMDLQEEGETYRITYAYDKEKLPRGVRIEFQGMTVIFSLPDDLLPKLIPTLASVESPLHVLLLEQEAVESVTYDTAKGALIIHKKERARDLEGLRQDAQKIGKWWYVPREGFVAQEQSDLFLESEIPEEKLPRALEQHPQLLAKYLKGTSLNKDVLSVHYTLSFDPKWNLHIDAYLKEPGDLAKPPSRLFGHWAYIDGQGFFKVKGSVFETAHVEIHESDVSDFVTSHRLFLNQFEMFREHRIFLEAKMQYVVQEDGSLLFKSLSETTEVVSKDFGDWIYLEGQGFYPKSLGKTDLGLYSGLRVPTERVAGFIAAHQDELEHVHGFFASRSPIIHVGVTIKLGRRDTIVVTPSYRYRPGIKESHLIHYDAFVYEKGAGFSELNVDPRLPPKFRRQRVIEKDQIPTFLSQEIDALRPFAHVIDRGLELPTELMLQVESIEETALGQVVLQLSYRSEWGSVSVEALWQAMHLRQFYLFSQAGFIDLHDPRFQWIRPLRGEQFEGGKLLLPTWEFVRLSSLETIQAPVKLEMEDLKSRLFNSLLKMEPPSKAVPKGLLCELRPYQEIGLQWLWYLYSFGLSGLLCDEMGLGKTHQTMALIASITHANKRKKLCFLIVCPTSVIYPWEDKLQRFFPSVPVYHFHGQKRSLRDFQKEGGILLTSYGIVRSELESLSKMTFEVAVFDEVQIAKNHASKTHQALARIQARMRLGLTGTPIENHLRELKALFDLVLPSYMPGETAYRELFVGPIEKDNDQDSKELLARFIKPFVLRRKKQEVLQELPEKVEELAFCELTEKQRELYQGALQKAKDTVLDKLADETEAIPYLSIFQLMTSLKQICDHPAVYLKEPHNYHHHSSGKWQLFCELLSEALGSEQKVVVFSHYLAMLDIIELHLKEQGIDYAGIRGETQNRREMLERFQNDPKCSVFVGSLQAVGFGVDLTAASVVIHYDRWWNAARENQATARVHRIGQVRGVQVFKLLTKETIEEHINDLIVSKGTLMEEVVSADDANELKRLSRQDLIELFRLGNAN